MKISQKKNCNRCKARVVDICKFGYKILRKTKLDPWYGFAITTEVRPYEPCPKPLTFEQFDEMLIDDSQSENPVLPIHKDAKSQG